MKDSFDLMDESLLEDTNQTQGNRRQGDTLSYGSNIDRSLLLKPNDSLRNYDILISKETELKLARYLDDL